MAYVRYNRYSIRRVLLRTELSVIFKRKQVQQQPKRMRKKGRKELGQTRDLAGVV